MLLGAARFPMHIIAAEHGTGPEELRTAIYRFLNVIRVYTKQPGKPPDLESPFTGPAGIMLLERAARVHRNFAESLKSARIWGTGFTTDRRSRATTCCTTRTSSNCTAEAAKRSEALTPRLLRYAACPA